MEPLNFFKDIGIAVSILFVFGRIMLRLVQAWIEHLQSVREDNKARNSHFGLLLATNQSIASQVELTRQAIERGTRAQDRHDDTLRSTTTVVSSLQQEMQQGFTTTQREVQSQVSPVLNGIAHLLVEMDALSKGIDSDNATLLGEIGSHIKTTQGFLAEQLLPIVTKLDDLTTQIVQTRQEIVAAVQYVAQPELPEGTQPATHRE
jgi:hypothetical protein